MKNLFLGISLMIGINISAQVMPEKANVFVRVYDLQENKIAKGKIISITDTALQLQGTPELIDFRNIGLIRSKRSAGHNVMVGAAAGAVVGAIAGATSAEPDGWFGLTPAEGAASGIMLGAPTGAAIGAITSLFKRSNTYVINGDQVKFREFNSAMSGSEH